MADEDRRMPTGMAGLTTYSDVNPEKISMKPEHVVAIIGAAVVAEVMLYLFL